ncbi:hypothetical protein AGLY_010874, partial [Aphis glycines]
MQLPIISKDSKTLFKEVQLKNYISLSIRHFLDSRDDVPWGHKIFKKLSKTLTINYQWRKKGGGLRVRTLPLACIIDLEHAIKRCNCTGIRSLKIQQNQDAASSSTSSECCLWNNGRRALNDIRLQKLIIVWPIISITLTFKMSCKCFNVMTKYFLSVVNKHKHVLILKDFKIDVLKVCVSIFKINYYCVFQNFNIFKECKQRECVL